jgi:hypothetical protein
MGTMHKEVVVKRRLPVILMLSILVVLMTYAAEFMEDLRVGPHTLGRTSTIFLAVVMLGIIFHQYIQCKIRYKYSIIADELIVHRIKGSTVKVVEAVKIEDIYFIGKKNDLKENIRIRKSKKYMCSVFNSEQFCCVYKAGDKFRKFYFEPSNQLINKVMFFKCKKAS